MEKDLGTRSLSEIVENLMLIGTDFTDFLARGTEGSKK